MALSWSTGIRNFANNRGSYQRALNGGIIELRTGSAPSTADAAVTGTLLCTVSLASASVTKEVLPAGTITISGSSGTCDSITVNGQEILGAAVTFTTDLTTTATLIADQINRYIPPGGVKYTATSAAAVITITALPGTGTSGNGYEISATGTTLTFASTQGLGTAAAGVCGSGGLTYGATTAGIMSKTGVWSGVNVASGVAGYFRILSSVNDTGTASTTAIRIQGACGISSGDYPMTSTTLTSGQTHTIDTFSLTLPSA